MRLALALVLAAGCSPLLPGPEQVTEVVWSRGDEQLVLDETIYPTFPDSSIHYEIRLESPRGNRVFATGSCEDKGTEIDTAVRAAIHRLPPI